MGMDLFIYGYIQSLHDADEFNTAALDSFTFDEVWPLPDIFTRPRRGYNWSLTAFGGAFKSAGFPHYRDDFREWLGRFEQLLAAMRAGSAMVQVDHETEPGPFYARYYCQEAFHWDKWELPGPRAWERTIQWPDEERLISEVIQLG